MGKSYHVCSLLTNSSAKVPGKSTKQMQNNWLKVWANIIILKLLAKLKKKGAIDFSGFVLYSTEDVVLAA